MRVVMADVQEEALHAAAAELKAQGGHVTPVVTDVASADSVDALAQATLRAYGIPNFVFNNAGVASGGLIWENSVADWQWVLGVNLMGVVHGIRSFTPLMLAQQENPAKTALLDLLAGRGPAHPPGTVCDGCGRPETEVRLRTCDGCLVARYCGNACAKAAWPAHKAECRRLQAAPWCLLISRHTRLPLCRLRLLRRRLPWP
jgi:NAD(P)-dependent dehydrogenase (short-subunit alcohol dehydrogenase family)